MSIKEDSLVGLITAHKACVNSDKLFSSFILNFYRDVTGNNNGYGTRSLHKQAKVRFKDFPPGDLPQEAKIHLTFMNRIVGIDICKNLVDILIDILGQQDSGERSIVYGIAQFINV